jgi:hypothetical protein
MANLPKAGRVRWSPTHSGSVAKQREGSADMRDEVVHAIAEEIGNGATLA